MSFRRADELTIDELREILHLPNHLIAIINPDGTLFKFHDHSKAILGWEPEEVNGRKVKDFLHPDDWSGVSASMERLRNGQSEVVEDLRNRVRAKNGNWRWISWNGKSKDGQVYLYGSDVTEKVEFEEALTVQSLVLESISEAVIICKENGLIVFSNTAAEKLYGYEMEELLGKNVSVLSPLSFAEIEDIFKYVIKTISQDRIWMGEFNNRKKNGEDIVVSCRVTTLNLNGEPHFVFVQRDMTSTKRLSREREQLENRFRGFFEQSSLGMYIYDIEGKLLELNRASEIIFGTNFEKSKNFNLLSDKSSQDLGLLPYIEKAINGEPAQTPAYYIQPSSVGNAKFNRPRWIEVLYSPIKDSQGKTRELAVIVNDVTDKKEHEEDQKFISDVSQILSSSFDYVSNIQKVCELMVNTYFDNMAVYEIRDERSYPIASANNDPEKFIVLKKILARHDEAMESNNRIITALKQSSEVYLPKVCDLLPAAGLPADYVELGKRLEIDSMFLINLQGKEGLTGFASFHVRAGRVIGERQKKVAREIAYRLSLAIENSVLYHQSQEAIRARDEFLSIASHELKTPLQSLTLQNEIRSRLIHKGSPRALDKDELLRALELDRRQLIRVNRLIEDMLDISRIRNARLSIHEEVFNLSQLISDVSERMKPQFEVAGCELHQDLEDHIQISADSYRIEQVMVNLFINAMKYGAGKPVLVRARKHDALAVIEVEDHGPGIHEQDLERIFLRFERAVRGSDVTGLGLGLYIAREIMALHHGKVYVKSRPGEGSTFIVEIPL